MKIFKTLIILFAFFLCTSLQGQQGEKGTLRVGMAKIDITPDIPVMLYGYAQRKTPSEGIHDPLSARAVVFEQNGKKVVLVSSDLGSYGADVFKVFQKSIMDKYKFKESEIFLSTIHSHSTPILSLDKERGNENNIKYTEGLNQKLLTLIGNAIKDLKPATIGMGVGYSPVGINRREQRADGSITLGRNPYGVTDKEVLVMKIATPDGTPFGAVFDYATHSTALGGKSMKISSDVLGLSAQFTEKILGKNVVSPVFAGASGNIDPWYRVLPEFNEEPGWIPEPVLLGTLLGEEVVTVFRNIKETSGNIGINSSFTTVEYPRKKVEAGVNASAASNRPQERPDTPLPVNFTAAKISDDIAFIGFNVEMITEIGMAIKAGSPFKYTFVITHCNGSSGYLVPANLYKEGGYEVNTTRFEIGSAEKIAKEALRILYDLK
jgi:hypothetical protein